jgi:hypothetical protein
MLEQMDLDWCESNGWQCPYCHDKLINVSESRDDIHHWTTIRYTCQCPSEPFCAIIFLCIRYAHQHGNVQDECARLKYWVEMEIETPAFS